MDRYKKLSKNGNSVKEHRAVWESINGPIPPGYEIHHINGDGNDNRIENLMMLTRKEHMRLHAKLRLSGKDPVDSQDPNVTKERNRQREYRELHRAELAEKQRARYANNKNRIVGTDEMLS